MIIFFQVKSEESKMIDRRTIAGTILKALRTARHVNQEVIANFCGRSISYISDWERGKTDIPLQVIGVYSQFLDIKESEILELIEFYKKKDEENPPFNGVNYQYPPFRDKVFRELIQRYEREPLYPRTREHLNPRF